VEFEKKGVPTVLICSTVHEPVARGLANTLGLRDVVIATIPHPFSWSGLTREQINERAAGVLNQVVLGLTGSTVSRAISSAGGAR